MPAVSVIIPVYNVEPYIARCARSLFGQTMQDLEFIFVDDCSPDRSMEILSEVLEEYPERKGQVRCLRLPRNGGLAHARLAGVAVAEGRYVAHCDSDDAFDPRTCELMYGKAVAEDLDIVTCDFRLTGQGKDRVQSQVSEPGREVSDILTGKVWGTVWSRLFRRELWEGMVPPRGGDMWEDVVFSVQATCRAYRIGHVATPLYNYYLRSRSISVEEGLSAAVRRWEAVKANAGQVLEFLSATSYPFVTEADVVTFKYRCREQLFPYVQIPAYFQMWKETFPEVDPVLLRTKGVPADTKFWFVLIHLHLYYPWKRITSVFRRKSSRR